MKTYFITGTNTEVGKTYVTTLLLAHYAQQGYRTVGLKPVASYSEITPAGLRNDDALKIQQVASVELPYEQINPYSFSGGPVTPHIIAEREQTPLTATQVTESIQTSLEVDADYAFVEGAGGWLLPLNANETMADVVQALKIPVILVVGLTLGCLNHTLLTWQSLTAANIPIAGWVVNHIDPEMLYQEENIETLEQHLGQPCLARIANGQRQWAHALI